jgi:hypothetical protein
MRTKSYRGHRVELESEAKRSGEWMARVTIVFTENDKEKRIPIFGRRRMTFDTRAQADSYGLELAKLWIDGKLWGANGHG